MNRTHTDLCSAILIAERVYSSVFRSIAGQFDDQRRHPFSRLVSIVFRSTDLRLNVGIGWFTLVLSSLMVSSAGVPGVDGVIFLFPLPIWPSADEVREKPWLANILYQDSFICSIFRRAVQHSGMVLSLISYMPS